MEWFDMGYYTVEMIQQQVYRVQVQADSSSDAIERVHNQHGDVVVELPPEILTGASVVIQQDHS
jgi:hypothetical protein